MQRAALTPRKLDKACLPNKAVQHEALGLAKLVTPQPSNGSGKKTFNCIFHARTPPTAPPGKLAARSGKKERILEECLSTYSALLD
jgi:hypothetical protein